MLVIGTYFLTNTPYTFGNLCCFRRIILPIWNLIVYFGNHLLTIRQKCLKKVQELKIFHQCLSNHQIYLSKHSRDWTQNIWSRVNSREKNWETTTTHNQLTKITDKFTHKHINNYTLTCLYLHKSPITFVRFTFWETLWSTRSLPIRMLLMSSSNAW